MIASQGQRQRWMVLPIALLAVTTTVTAQSLDEDFNAATGSGGGAFFSGQGFFETLEWDSGITGESAFAGTDGNASFGSVSADGLTSGGVDGTGAGAIAVSGVLYDLINQMFESVTGTGGGEFLAGGAGPDTFNSVLNWDDGIENEAAFGGTFGGADLIGNMSARGLPSGGLTGGGAEVDVNNVALNGGGWFAGLQFDVSGFPGVASLANAGLELGEPGWLSFGNAFEFPALDDAFRPAPLSGDGIAKTFGSFPGPSGLFQDFPTQEGQMVTFSAFANTFPGDSIAGTTNSAQLRIEWRDGETVIQTDFEIVIDPNDPNFAEDVWFPGTVTGTAPAGATTVRVLLWFDQPNFDPGAVWWDEASLSVTGPGGLDLTQIDFSANVRGLIDGSETFGAIQMRLEDPAGGRLLTEVVADGSWQSIGGPLSGFTEADPNGTPMAGAFNENADSYRVVVAFSESTSWNTGGTIQLDNLVLTNDSPEGSAWFAGLFFDQLDLPILDPNAIQILDPNLVVLLGDVKGSAAAPYVLRLEAIDTRLAGIDDDYSGVLGDCGTGDPNSCNLLFRVGGTGPLVGPTSSANFDSGIEGEAAFSGTFGSVLPIGSAAGVTVSGLPAGGVDGGGSIEIAVAGISPSAGGGWFAGIDYPNQNLASGDLSTVTLSADVRGTPDPLFGGPLGLYELRIEDAEGDRLAFQVVANGAWQSIGGTLDTAMELAAADGGGDGVFDLDDDTYNVVIAFEGDPDPSDWVTGGVLEIDNLFLTGAEIEVELGQFVFNEAGNTDFETVGGFLSGADAITLDFEGSTGGLNVIDLENGVPAGLVPQNGEWDTGLANEGSFSGGGLVSANIETCASCGVGGGQAVRTVIEQSSTDWFSGFFFTDIALDLSAGAGDNLDALSGITLTAEFNADPNSAMPRGDVELRIEDAQTDTIFIQLQATGGWQTIGGSINATDWARGFADPGQQNGVFDYNQETYTITVAISNFTPNQWSGLIDVAVDNISYTGVPSLVTSPDSFTVTTTFADEASTWGTDGTLTVDNLLLAVVPNCETDQSFDLRDVARAQQCIAGDGVMVAADCVCADLDGDGDVDSADDIPDAAGRLPSAIVLP